jgi:hypothetical protein
MVDILMLLWSALTGLFRSRARLEAEILVLRHQINVLRRNSPKSLFSGLSTDWCSLGCIASLPALQMRWPSSGLRPWFVGTVQDFDHSGVGDPDGVAGDRASRVSSVS